jgi:hypothetical protein
VPHSPLNPFELPDDPGAGYRNLVDMVTHIDTMSNLLVSYGFLQGINLLMLMARVMKMLKFQPRLALVTNTFASGWVDLTHFFSVFMMFMTMMAVAAHVQFGSVIEEVSTMTKSFNYMFIMLLGEFTFTEFYQEDVALTWIDQAAISIFVTFTPVFFTLLLINFLLGIVGDAFGVGPNR